MWKTSKQYAVKIAKAKKKVLHYLVLKLITLRIDNQLNYLFIYDAPVA